MSQFRFQTLSFHESFGFPGVDIRSTLVPLPRVTCFAPCLGGLAAEDLDLSLQDFGCPGTTPFAVVFASQVGSVVARSCDHIKVI